MSQIQMTVITDPSYMHFLSAGYNTESSFNAGLTLLFVSSFDLLVPLSVGQDGPSVALVYL